MDTLRQPTEETRAALDHFDRLQALTRQERQRLFDCLSGYVSPGMSALEVGVGTGEVALAFAEYGLIMIGVDPSTEMLSRAASKATDHDLVIQLLHGRGESLGFPAESFDVVIASRVLAQIPQWAQVLGEMARVAKADGSLLVSFGWRDPIRVELHHRFVIEAQKEREHPGLDPSDEQALIETLASRGWQGIALPDLARTVDTSIAEILVDYERGWFVTSWDLDPDIYRSAVDGLAKWANERWAGTLHERHVRKAIQRWWVFHRGRRSGP